MMLMKYNIILMYKTILRVTLLICVVFFFLDFMWPLGTLPDGEYNHLFSIIITVVKKKNKQKNNRTNKTNTLQNFFLPFIHSVFFSRRDPVLCVSRFFFLFFSIPEYY